MALTVLLFETTALLAIFYAAVLSSTGIQGSDYAWLQSLVLSGSCIAAFYFNDLYDYKVVRNFRSFLSRVPRSFVAAILSAAVLVMIVFPAGTLSVQDMIRALGAMIGLVLASRAMTYRFMRSRPFVENVLVLGKTPLARAVIAEMETRPRYRVLDTVDHAALHRIINQQHLPLLVHQNRTLTAVLRPDRIIVALGERRGRLPVEALLDARRQGIAIEEGTHLYERLTGKLAIESLNPSHLIFSPDFGRSTIHRWLGRAMSVSASLLGLLLCAPLLGIIAVTIKLDSPGPIFFVQDRIGRDGRRFSLFKFRTMQPIAERRSEWVRDNGDRITRAGKWLRKFRLDEVPQLFNVLRGDMNLVGPRPHPATNYELFASQIPFYAFRSTVQPGITGWAQVLYGYANNLEEETEKMRYDLYYIKYYSLWLDIEILMRTVKVILLGKEAKREREASLSTTTTTTMLDRRADAA
jgi:exopolysaccharide biosynthesis polyprenyl glycosylphosphotransferase